MAAGGFLPWPRAQPRLSVVRGHFGVFWSTVGLGDAAGTGLAGSCGAGEPRHRRCRQSSDGLNQGDASRFNQKRMVRKQGGILAF